MLNKKDMQALINEIIELGNELRLYHEVDDENADANPAPEEKLLSDFEKRCPFKFPPSYLRLLSIYNGVENFDWIDVSLLSMEYLMQHEDLENYWVDVDAFSKGELFIFAQSKSEDQVIAFLTKTVGDDGEMKVVRLDVSRGVIEEHQNLEKYLRDRCDWFAHYVAKEKADRKGFSEND